MRRTRSSGAPSTRPAPRQARSAGSRTWAPTLGVQRVGLDGAPIGSSVPVSETGGVGPGSDGDNQRPRVAYDPDRDEYLVVWIDGRDLPRV